MSIEQTLVRFIKRYKMKIAFVIYNLSGGGAEKVVSLLSSEMSLNHEVNIINFDEGIDYKYGGDVINLNIPSSNNIFFKFYNILRRASRLSKLFKTKKYDKIFSFMESSNIPSIMVSNNVIVSVRNDPFKFDKITQFLIKVLYKKAKCVIVNSKENNEVLRKYFKLNNVEVIYNPLNIDDIQKNRKEKLDINYKFILAIGRLDYQKGFDLLIKAYSQTVIKNDVKLLIFGEGKLKNDLHQLISTLDLEENIFLMGKTNNPYKYMSQAEMFVLSSRHEGFPNVLVEAMACECLVLATDCPTGPKEILQENKNGILVKNENINELTSMIDNFYYNTPKCEQIRLNALTYVKSLNVELIAKKWLEI
mgnify:CR=1 FL=1